MNDDFEVASGLDGPVIVGPSPADTSTQGIDALYVIGAFAVGGRGSENAFTLNGKAYSLAAALEA